MDTKMFATYQENALKTLKPNQSFNEQLLMVALGLCGEIAELEVFLSKEEKVDESGDVFWYASLGCHISNISLEQMVKSIEIDSYGLSINKITDSLILMSKLAGYNADYVKKVVLHSHPFEPHVLQSYLRAILRWMLFFCKSQKLDIEEVLKFNNEKLLKKRYPNGFSAEFSINREA